MNPPVAPTKPGEMPGSANGAPGSPACPNQPWTGALRSLPAAVRLLIAGFLVIVAAGYLVAVANVFYSHRFADGVPGMGIDDIRAVYGGLTVSAGSSSPVPSRMLTMIRTEMREYFRSDSDFEVLEAWLEGGGPEAGLDSGEGRNTPRRVLVRNCLRCHAVGGEGDISRTAPFGPDVMTVDYAGLRPLTAPPAAAPGSTTRAPPQYTIARLVLVSHQHMLSIPLFTLVVGLMFSTTRTSPVFRAVLTPMPMLAAAVDFAGWWISRSTGFGAIMVLAAGGAFGISFGVQILCTLLELWRPGRPRG